LGTTARSIPRDGILEVLEDVREDHRVETGSLGREPRQGVLQAALEQSVVVRLRPSGTNGVLFDARELPARPPDPGEAQTPGSAADVQEARRAVRKAVDDFRTRVLGAVANRERRQNREWRRVQG
jgi:hypothetical protein